MSRKTDTIAVETPKGSLTLCSHQLGVRFETRVQKFARYSAEHAIEQWTQKERGAGGNNPEYELVHKHWHEGCFRIVRNCVIAGVSAPVRHDVVAIGRLTVEIIHSPRLRGLRTTVAVFLNYIFCSRTQVRTTVKGGMDASCGRAQSRSRELVGQVH